MTVYQIAFSDTEYFINKYYYAQNNISYNYQTIRFSPYLDNQYDYKFYIPITTKILSFDISLCEPEGISQYLLFVLRYGIKPSTSYDMWSFLEGTSTVSYLNNKYHYVFPYRVSYDYSGSIYSFPNSSVVRGMNPFNVGGLTMCREQDHKVQLRDSDVVNKMNVFHMYKYKSNIGLKEAGNWMYLHIVAGKNFARSMIINMYL